MNGEVVLGRNPEPVGRLASPQDSGYATLVQCACPHRDLSMILCDPFAINTLSLSTVRHLQELVGQETLPRVSARGWLHAASWVDAWVWTVGGQVCWPSESTYSS